VNFRAPILFLLLVVAVAPGRAADSAPKPGPFPPAINDTIGAEELKQLEAADDTAQAEVDQWVRENNALKAKGAGISQADLEERISKRLEPVGRSYEDFLRRHPDNSRAHLLYGGFLNDRQNENAARIQWEKALELDPTNAACYNNLAGRYGESGPVSKAFEYYAKALELGPTEPVYYHNFADFMYVARKRAAAYYGIDEQQVYLKVLGLYSNALRLDPLNVAFARDLAQTYFSLKPLPVDSALQAWTNTLHIAREEVDCEDVYINMARVKMLGGRLAEARAQLAAVTNSPLLPARTTLLHNIEEREHSGTTNSVVPGH
jgi:tetratricopeptide (TPR) repeat protein